MLKTSVRRRGGPRFERCRRSYLPSCHPVNHVVSHNNEYVRVSSCSLNEMVQTDSYDVSVTTENHHVQIWPDEFDGRGCRYASSMKRVNRVRHEIRRRNPRGTAYTACEAELAQVLMTQFVNCLQERVSQREESATRTKRQLQISHEFSR